MDKKITHMEMIQNVISRMASNSFSLKEWSVTLVAGIFALSSKDANKAFAFLTLVPILVFGCLDAYYLQQERLFRALYDKVRKMPEEDIDFGMNIADPDICSEKTKYKSCLFSKTILGFYLPVAAICIVIIVLIFCLCP